ncbi:MAG TPA: superoxide dismutase [Allosphingosinicella sp.]|nr:superoxide dismutase [Allosphingosinicella sp.]
MTFVLPPLPYPSDSFGDVMSAETLEYHHGKHHQAYVDGTNKLVEGTNLENRRLSDVIRTARANRDDGLFNQSAQLWNHSFFWQCLAPPSGQRPDGRLAGMIEDQFGSTEQLLSRLKEEATGHFSNGWAWLVLERGRLDVLSLHDADSPVVYEGIQPLLTLDVWEHAYYIDYRNDRGGFAESVLGRLVNWEFVAANLDGEGVARADQDPR